ncbi:MAG TPA: ABC transporter permease [Streptosporangiaceae bacterium]|nr:ABC transporter permease [Streptosporangiaceae bacterium]
MMAKVTLRNLAAHKLRLGLTAIAVILGVAFVAGTLIFTDTMSRQFDDIFSRVGKGVAVDVRARQVVDGGDEQSGAAQPVPAAVLETVRRVEGVRDPVGHVFGYAAVIGRDGKVVATQGPPQMGINWVSGGGYQMTSGRAPRGPAEVAIDENTAKKAGYRIGDEAGIVVQGPARRMRVVGIVGTGNLMGAGLTAFDTATAQHLLLRPGYYSHIAMGSTGPGEDELRARVAGVLPGNLEAITGTTMRADAKSDVAQIMSFFRTFLLVFALISIFVGAFIIFNTFTMLVAQRTRELALLRAVGAARPQVTRAVIGEAIAVGVVGSTLGLAFGAGIALLLRQVMFGGSGDAPSGLVFTATPVIWSYVVGVVVTVVAAYVPARRAAMIPPVAAMRDDVALPRRSLRMRFGAGGVLTAAGAATMGLGLAGALGGSPMVAIGAGAFLVFLGVAMLAPVISRPVVRVLSAPYPRLFKTPGRLARRNALRNPRRTAATASALMIGLALITTVNVLGASMSASIDKAVDRQFGADYVVAAQTEAGFGRDVVDAVAATAGVERATAYYTGEANIGGKRAAYVSGDVAGLASGARLKMVAGGTDLGTDGMLVSEDVAKARHWVPGSTAFAEFPDGARQRLRIAGVYAANELLGPRVLALPAYQAHTSRQLARLVLVTAQRPDAAAKAAIERSLRDYPTLTVRDQAGVKREARRQIDQFVTFLTILLTMSVIIAAVGVINTLALSVIERTREIGLLRAVGTSRRQLRRMIRLESVVIAVFGALLGVGIGVSFGAAIQRGLAGEGLDVLAVPVGTLVIYVVLGGLIGVLAALWPAWRAGRMDVLTAIATE